MSSPCSTMPAVVPATALTEAGAVVCRPTEKQREEGGGDGEGGGRYLEADGGEEATAK